MAKKITELVGPDGSIIYLQYESEDSDKLEAIGWFEDIGKRTEEFKKTLVNTINGYSTLILDTVKKGMKDLSSPDSVKLEFGLQIGGKSGIAFITMGNVQANVKVTLEWKLGKES